MVAKITTPQSILKVLNYNEKKVQKEQAECILAGNFLMEHERMNFYDKLNRFNNLIELNSRSKTNTLHISLNFDPTEKFGRDKLIEIASAYMVKIGFGNQPHLVYQHLDAGHPHIHIVTTSIQENGKRIDTYNIGRNQSEKARIEIEKSFGLIRATYRNFKMTEGVEAIPAQKVKYGLSETKRSITNVLASVINQYKYTSIAELNAVLKLYNVLADRGVEEGRIFRKRGLTYRVLDEKGNKIGVPIKASSIYLKPTLNFLEKRFLENDNLRQPHKQKLKTAIDWVVSKNPASMAEFVSELARNRIATVLRQNEKGFIYGITFIDHRTKTVFNGSDLGKSYSACSIQDRISKTLDSKESSVTGLLQKAGTIQKSEEKEKEIQLLPGSLNTNIHVQKSESLLDVLMKSERNASQLPYDLVKKKKKKKKFNL